jgi:acyl carrier protein
VLDPLGARVPIGVPGELLIGGIGVARGYLRRPELEQERFVVGTDLTGQPRRFYRTGDRVRWLDDGRLEFLGRFDEQLKLRGHRIEPGEIEACLNSHPGVRASAVLLRADPDCPRQLVAYVVPTQAELAPLVLREHLARALPAYMLPAAYVSLTTLPVGPHGKLLRGALPAPERRHLTGDNPVLAPRTALESTLAGYVAELLGAASVGIEDDFFELGGHSLLATRLVSRVKREFQIELPLRVFLERPRVAALAEAVERARAQAPEAASVGTFADDADRLRARLAHMSDEEVDALLARELQRQEVAS